MVVPKPSDALLDQVAGYALDALSSVTATNLSAPTPCSGWDVLAVLLHLNTTLGRLLAGSEGWTADGVAYDPAPHRRADSASGLGAAPSGGSSVDVGRWPRPDLFAEDGGEVIAAGVQCRIERFRRACAAARGGPCPAAADAPARPHAVVVATGAVEIAVHAWDVATACGRRLPIPEAPAAELLALSSRFAVSGRCSAPFSGPVAPLPGAAPGDRFVALLGRGPHISHGSR